MPDRIETALHKTRQQLLALQKDAAHWTGELSSSALSTATAIVALHGVDAVRHALLIQAGAGWLVRHQNADGGWGDTTISKSNLSTTLLCWSALSLCQDTETRRRGDTEKNCEAWIASVVGSLEPEKIMQAVIARYGRDKTFSVPILMLCTICGTMEAGGIGVQHCETRPRKVEEGGQQARVLANAPTQRAWRRVLPLPFELAALPRRWFGAVGLPVVSYALPALIAIGYTRFKNAPPAWWNPQRWLRAALWQRISPMLKTLQPSSGGYLEATPLTSFVTMALAAADEKEHPCVPGAVAFLTASMRADGSWPIDTNLATWGTTLSVKALGEMSAETRTWLLRQQYQDVHPFTNAAPGGWAWTDLPGGVPDADDTAGALIALHTQGSKAAFAALAGCRWLLDLQNRDGGIPTFCRGWGTLPFDRSSPELTAHALLAWWLWQPESLRNRLVIATRSALRYLAKTQRVDGSWIPLWFGNENALHEDNPVYGTAIVVGYLSGVAALAEQAGDLIERGQAYLMSQQKADGGWGGDASAPTTIEETAVTLHALCLCRKNKPDSVSPLVLKRGACWLLDATEDGTNFPAAPIGLYFARLWYHEKLYPVVWTLQALRSLQAAEIEVEAQA